MSAIWLHPNTPLLYKTIIDFLSSAQFLVGRDGIVFGANSFPFGTLNELHDKISYYEIYERKCNEHKDLFQFSLSLTQLQTIYPIKVCYVKSES